MKRLPEEVSSNARGGNGCGGTEEVGALARVSGTAQKIGEKFVDAPPKLVDEAQEDDVDSEGEEWEFDEYFEQAERSKFDITSTYGRRLCGGIIQYCGEDDSTEYIRELSRFAVEHFNKDSGKTLAFKKVLKANSQVAFGAVFYITLEAVDADGHSDIFEAMVLHTPKGRRVESFELKYRS